MILDVCLYLVVFFFEALLMMVYQRNYNSIVIKNGLNKTRRITAFIYCVMGCVFLFPLIAMYGLRYGIGPDYFSYEKIFYEVHDTSILDYLYFHKNSIGSFYVEPLYYVLNIVFPSYRLLLWGVGILIFAVICLSLREYSSELSFSFALFIFLCTQFIYSIDTVRFVIAICFLLLAYIALSKEKILKFCIYVMIGTLFHRSVILCIMMFFLKEFKSNTINRIRNILMAICILLVPFLVAYVFNYLQTISIFSRYFSTGVYRQSFDYEGGIKWLIHIIPVLGPLVVFCRREVFCEKDTKLFFRIAIMDIPFRILGMYNTWFTRYTRCSQIVQVILIPLVISRVKSLHKKYLLVSYYVLWYVFDFCYYAIVNSSGSSLPYTWVFSNI